MICPRSGKKTKGIFSADDPLTNGAKVHSRRYKNNQTIQFRIAIKTNRKSSETIPIFNNPQEVTKNI